MDKKENDEKHKDIKHHHHHHKKLSTPSKIIVKHYNNGDKQISDKKLTENNEPKVTSNNDVINKENQKEEKKQHKHHHHKRSSSIITSQREKDYFRNKLENFGKSSKEKKKSYKNPEANHNLPRNIDKNTAKYYRKLAEKNKRKHKIENNESGKESNISQNIDNNNQKNNLQNNELESNKEQNKYHIEDSINMVNKNIEKHKDEYERLIGLSNKDLIYVNYKDAKKDSEKVDRPIKRKSQYYVQNRRNGNNIIEGMFNLDQQQLNDNNKNSKDAMENKDGNNNNNLKKRGRKASMIISSRYSVKMKSQIEEERENINKQQEKLEKKKNKLLHMEEIQKKESFAQEHFIKNFSLSLSPDIDYGRISARLPGDYTFLQSKLIYLELSCPEEEFNYIYNKKNFYKSKNAKELCRKGIPLKYMKIFFKKLLNLENFKENYSIKYEMVIKGIDPNYLGDYVPYCCGQNKKKLKEILPIHYLNEEGITHLKIIMWLISDLVPEIEYCPLLTKITSILLIFLEKEEVYEAMRTLIEMNYKPSEMSKLRWHFLYTINENNKLYDSIRVFLENESANMKNLFLFFKERGLEPNLLIKDFCDGLFLNYLNFYGILRFICIFIYEGAKSLYRFTYGLLNYLFEEKLEEMKNNKNDLISQIRNNILNITDYKKIISDTFNLKINRFNNGYANNDSGKEVEDPEKPYESFSSYNNESDNEKESNINDNNNKKNKKESNYLYEFYLPSIEPKSNILSSKEIIYLWSKLPLEMKHHNLATIYSLSRKKVNMKSIIELIKKYPKNFSNLILIETEQNEIFGIHLPEMLKETEENEYIQMDKCSLIQIKPKFGIYKDAYTKGINMLCCNKRGLWFCKQDVGDLIYLEGTLTEGQTCKNNTYFGKVYLTRKDNFLIKDLEIIIFIKNDNF